MQRRDVKRIDIMAIGTDDADWNLLARIANRKNLAVKVQAKQLGQGIASMAKLLPKPRGGMP